MWAARANLNEVLPTRLSELKPNQELWAWAQSFKRPLGILPAGHAPTPNRALPSRPNSVQEESLESAEFDISCEVQKLMEFKAKGFFKETYPGGPHRCPFTGERVRRTEVDEAIRV